MAIWQFLKISRKTFFNPRAWINYDSLKTGNATIWNSIKDLFIIPKATRTETFAEAVERQDLSEAQIKAAQENYFFLALAFLAFSLIIFLITLYILFRYHSFYALLIGLSCAALFAGQAFKFHFWYFQIKHRKLGCTFEEWRRGKPDLGKPHG